VIAYGFLEIRYYLSHINNLAKMTTVIIISDECDSILYKCTDSH